MIGAAALATSGHAEDREIAKRRAAERKTFTDAEIFDGFFKVAFGAEMRLAGRVDGIRKYDGPVRVYIENRVKPDRSAQIADVVADIKTRVQHLDIANEQGVRNQQPVALPPKRLGAHHRNAPIAAEIEQSIDRLGELRSLHVVGVAAKRLIPPCAVV